MRTWEEICAIKDNLQNEGIEAWKKSNGRSSLIRYTGFGKSTEAIKIIAKCKEKNPDLEVYITTPTLLSVEQWIKATEHFTNITVVTHIKASKSNAITGLFIIDEVDCALAVTLAKMFENVNYKYILCLTATLKRKDKREDLLKKYAPVVHTITLKQGIDLGIVSYHIVFNYNITLNEEEQKKYEDLNKKLDVCFAVFNRDYNLMRKCNKLKGCKEYLKTTDLTLFDTDFKELEEKDTIKKLQTYAGLSQKFIADREAMIQKSETIKAVTAKLVTMFNVKTICFGEHNETADEVCERINIIENSAKAFSYHSKKSDKENNLNFESFRLGLYKYAISSRKLIAGVNEEDLILGVDVSYTSSERDYQQKKGRVLRIDKNNLKKTAVFVNIVVENTVSNSWNKSKTFGDKSIINVNSLETLYEIYKQKLNQLNNNVV
jgi:superfamily II DNA or RNA helicase